MVYDRQRFRREAARRFGVEAFRPGQEEILRAVMAGRDTVGLLPTGAGKSLCYQLPSLFLAKATVVVSPLIALMQDQQEKLAEADIDAAKLNSTLTRSEERETAAEIAAGEVRIVYVTPERLENPDYIDLLRAQGVSLLVVDEAHCISQWGHDFRPAYLALREAIRQLGSPPVLALTATATPEVVADIVAQLQLSAPLIVNTGIERPNLFWEVFRTVNAAEKQRRLTEILGTETGCGIIYVATVKLAEGLWRSFQGTGIPAARYHGRLPKREREEIQQRFMDGEFRVIVATNAFGLGIDKPDIRFVVHYTFPDSLETYYQEAGRAGRDGQPARAILLYRLEDRRIQAYFLGGKYPKRDDSLRVYRLLAAEAAPRPLKWLAERAGIGDRRLRVIVAQLAGAEIVERSRRGVVKTRDFANAEAFDAFLSEYEQRHQSDRERLRTMMRYAETTTCRMRSICDYFELPRQEDCGHCDNCRDRAAGRLPGSTIAPPQPPAPISHPSAAESEWQAGEAVRHRHFGRGRIIALAGANVVVDFERGGRKKVRPSYLAHAGESAA